MTARLGSQNAKAILGWYVTRSTMPARASWLVPPVRLHVDRRVIDCGGADAVSRSALA
jgi:hypothetical protein